MSAETSEVGRIVKNVFKKYSPAGVYYSNFVSIFLKFIMSYIFSSR